MLPPTFLPYFADSFGVQCYQDMKEGIKNCDIIMLLRLQKERIKGTFIPSQREYYQLYGLDRDKLAYANNNAIIMHPGPINRGVEIDTELADDDNINVILQQVEMGIALRQAILQFILEHSRHV